MLPDLLLLLALLLGFHALEGADPAGSADLVRGLAGTAAATLVAIVWSRLVADRTTRLAQEEGPEAGLPGSRSPMLHPLLAWLASLFAFDWAALVASRIPSSWFVLPHIVFFTPLALTTGAAWIAVDRTESAMLRRPASARRALRAGLRRNAIAWIPVGIILVLQRGLVTLDELGVRAAGRILTAFHAWPDLVYGALALGVLGFLLVAPSLLRRAFGAVPLPAGEVRTRVVALLDRLGVRRRDVLVWPTGGRIRNAMTMGITGRTRYIVLSDALVTTFPLPELLAVVAHEAGHVVRGHFLLQACALTALLLLFLGAGALLSPWIPEAGETTLALLVLWFGWFGLVRRLSRRFETESDLYAAEHAADGDPTAAGEPGLEGVPPGAARAILAARRVARADDGGMRHPPTRDRIATIAAWAVDERVRRAEAQAARGTRLRIAGLVLAAIAVTVVRAPSTWAKGQTTMAFADAYDLATDAERATDAAIGAALRRRALDGFLDAVARADALPRDPTMRRIAAVAEYDAADLRIRHFGDPDAGRTGLEKTLSRLDLLDAGELGRIRHAALLDLGRLELATAKDPAAGVEAAKVRLRSAGAVAVEPAFERFVRARERLLEAAIGLRSDDPAVAERARRELEVRAKGVADDDAAWRELAGDAAAELARAAVSPRGSTPADAASK